MSIFFCGISDVDEVFERNGRWSQGRMDAGRGSRQHSPESALWRLSFSACWPSLVRPSPPTVPHGARRQPPPTAGTSRRPPAAGLIASGSAPEGAGLRVLLGGAKSGAPRISNPGPCETNSLPPRNPPNPPGSLNTWRKHGPGPSAARWSMPSGGRLAIGQRRRELGKPDRLPREVLLGGSHPRPGRPSRR